MCMGKLGLFAGGKNNSEFGIVKGSASAQGIKSLIN